MNYNSLESYLWTVLMNDWCGGVYQMKSMLKEYVQMKTDKIPGLLNYWCPVHDLYGYRCFFVIERKSSMIYDNYFQLTPHTLKGYLWITTESNYFTYFLFIRTCYSPVYFLFNMKQFKNVTWSRRYPRFQIIHNRTLTIAAKVVFVYFNTGGRSSVISCSL